MGIGRAGSSGQLSVMLCYVQRDDLDVDDKMDDPRGKKILRSDLSRPLHFNALKAKSGVTLATPDFAMF